MRIFSSVHFLLALGIVSCATPSKAQQARGAESAQVQVAELLSSVQAALAEAQKELSREEVPLLKSVTLDLSTEAKKDAGGKISLYVVSFGAKREKAESQEIEITLTPPPKGSTQKAGFKPAVVTDRLVAAIVTAAHGVRGAGANKDFPLVFSGLKVTLGFEVTTVGSPGVKFEILPVGFELSGDVSRSTAQKITVQYENPAPKQ